MGGPFGLGQGFAGEMMGVDCPAFITGCCGNACWHERHQSLPLSRNTDDDWKVLAPVMLHIDGRLLGPMVGTTFEPGTTTNGIAISEVLDRECLLSPLQWARR